MGLRVFLLGRPEFWVGERPLTGFNSLKGQALLAYLVMTRQPHSRTALAGLLWGEMTESAARSNLRVVLSQLKKEVGDYLLISRREVGVDPESEIWLDVTALETAVADDELNQDAAPLYRGDFMDDFHLPEALAFEEWLLTQRARLQQVGVRLYEQLVQQQTAQGELGEAVEMARRLVSLEPWSEAGQGQLIRLLALTGQQAAALAQFEAYRAELELELGVEPSEGLRDFVAQVRQGEVGGQRAALLLIPTVPTEKRPSHNLPKARSSFVGREGEVTAVLELLAKEDVRLVTLLGAGGMGKTRLSLMVGQQLVEDEALPFPDGIYFVSLAAIQPTKRTDDTDRNAIISAVNQALDLPQSGQTPQMQLLNGLRDKRLLLILDNVEHLIEEAELATALLEAGKQMKLLLTSRVRLNLYEEWVFDLDGLAVPKEGEAGSALANNPSVQLFAERAQRVQRRFALRDELLEVAEICRLVQGSPLGIELAAAWVRTMRCAEIVAEIRQNLDFLASSMRNVPERQRSLRSVFDYSWRLLDEVEQVAFARLSYFRGGFVARAAAQVADAPVSLLMQLVDKSLLTRDEAGRYGVHELLRQFGAERLADGDAVAAAHARYFGRLLAAHERALRRGERQAFRLLQLEVENVLLAWRWAAEAGETAVLGQLLHSLHALYNRQGWFVAWQRELGLALSGSEAIEKSERLRSRLHFRLGQVLDQLGQYETAVVQVQQSLALAERVGWAEQTGRATALLGFVELALGDYQAGGQKLTQGLATARRLGDKFGEAQTLVYLSYYDTGVGARKQGAAHVAEALALYEQLGDEPHRATCLFLLGNFAIGFGDYQVAMERYEAAKVLYASVGNRMQMAHCWRNEGLAAVWLGELDKAARLSQESLRLFREFGDSFGVARSLEILGLAATMRQAYAAAKAHLSEGVALFEANGNPPRGALLRAYLGKVLARLGELEAARVQLVEALTVNQDVGSVGSLLLCFPAAAVYLAETGELGLAVQTVAHVLHNPKAEAGNKTDALGVLEEMKTAVVDEAQMGAWMEEGERMTLEEITERLLAVLKV